MTIAELRENKLLTMREAAVAVGVTERTWWSWENSYVYPSVRHRRAIADYFKVEHGDVEWPIVRTKLKD